MRNFLRPLGAGVVLLGVGFCLSCEKHHVGELPPEHRAETGHEAKKAENGPAQEAREQNRDGSPTPSASATPAEFFPTATPH